ncbi:oxidoreductase [Mucilaginibacter hurinus]|uniref:Oxidoreductase n=1 Tax=Mucilaginibacter hurinus TaxID=2201324 RepID=A0A367GR66_9SPHI|nr:FAD-dependent oxidoreductase [Mucilaginibacter hurinus]RCH55203.1 oxidoreductase [Mucilaginibacter hurinus]
MDPSIKKDQHTNRDGKNVSLWQDGVKLYRAEALFIDNVYDVLVIGGGITGITTALLLQQQGKNVVLAEAKTIGFGTTGGTSAHLNTFFDATYPEIDSDFGADASKLLAQGGIEAMAFIEEMVKKYAIDCDHEYKDAYLFSQNEDESKQLDDILTSSNNAGIKVTQVDTNGVNVPFEKSILFKNQGQFHPLKYISKLAEEFVNAGGVILENTFINDIKSDDEIHIATSGDLSIKAFNMVYATHMPPGITLFNFNCAPYRSYVISVTLADDNYPDCLAYDMKEPYHYFRTHTVDGKKHLIVGGEDHKTGHDDPEKAFEELETYVRQHYKVTSVNHKWSSQYYVPADLLPFIGRLPMAANNVFAATGYNGNGMMFGTLAGKILADLIAGKQNPYAKLFSPSRIKPIAGFSEFVKENADVAYRFVTDRFSAEEIDSLKTLEKDSGAIVKYNDQKLAVYKDAEGGIHALSPVCTHAGCVVNFNASEKTWDCPCHGGRFDIDGNVLTGPPMKELKKVNLT